MLPETPDQLVAENDSLLARRGILIDDYNGPRCFRFQPLTVFVCSRHGCGGGSSLYRWPFAARKVLRTTSTLLPGGRKSRKYLRRKALDPPGLVRLPSAAEAIVEPVGPPLPELDARWGQDVTAPMRRPGDWLPCVDRKST